MNKQFKQVYEFNHTFKQQMNTEPTLLSSEQSKLCFSLLQEELNEYSKAVEDFDITEVADALIDLDYVLKGVMLKHGIVSRYERLFDNVHESNMSKVCTIMVEAINTVEYYQIKGVETEVSERNNKYLVFRKSDNKVLKSINYTPANLKQILND